MSRSSSSIGSDTYDQKENARDSVQNAYFVKHVKNDSWFSKIKDKYDKEDGQESSMDTVKMSDINESIIDSKYLKEKEEEKKTEIDDSSIN